MDKLKSWDDLKKFREEVQKDSNILSDTSDKIVVAVGEATCGIAAGSKEISEILKEDINKHGLKNVSVITTGCLGFCYAEPMVEVREPGKKSVYYGYVTEEAAHDIVSGHLVQGKPLTQNIFNVEVLIP